MINTLAQLSQILENANSWHIAGESTFIAFNNGEYCDDDSEEFIVPAALLAELHQDFPVALRAQIEWTQSNSSSHQPVTFGSSVISTLALLQKGSYEFNDVIGLKHTIVNINNISLDNAVQSVLILGSSCSIERVDIKGKTVSFVKACRHLRSTQVGFEELDKQYPGWKSRWEIGEQLGLNVAELIPYVFEKSSPQVTIPSIAFE